jgi:hypothetical protein
MKKLKPIRHDSTLMATLSDCIGELTSIGEECGESRDNLEERFSGTERYQNFSDAADELEGIEEPDIPECYREHPVTYTTFHKGGKRGDSKSQRLSNAMAGIEAALSEVNDLLEAEEDEDVKGELETLQEALQEIHDKQDAITL